jgi:DNA-binding transcriptional regulator YdaS (Cro superfamily)
MSTDNLATAGERIRGSRYQTDAQRPAGLKKAISAAGGICGLARRLGISRVAILQWQRVPAERVIEIERVTGVPREQLRPDLYPADRKLCEQHPEVPQFEHDEDDGDEDDFEDDEDDENDGDDE